MSEELQQIDLDNQEFQNVWKLISYTHQSVFLTGKAGSGKSTFLKYICENTRKKYVVLAPTGIAAVNVGGVTLHSFFRIPLKPLLPDDPDFAVSRLRSRLKYPKNLQKVIRELELIIIDEISMVRADIIDFIDKVLRVYGGNMREPFGGKQLLLVGDIFQLEPVVTADMRDLLRKYYPNSYFFSANAFKQLNIVPIELRKIYRQNDAQFIEMLDRIRMGHVLASDITKLNSRHGDCIDEDNDKFVMTLATRRDIVDAINEEHLAQLKTPEVEYEGDISGDFPESALPTSMELTLKVGAQIVFIKNDREHRWVNGTIGKVVKATDDCLEVQLESGDKHIVERALWENIEYKFDEETKRVVEKQIGSFVQFPVKLAWALTIHKSQGLTFNNVIIDMGRGAFSGGQTYVALSRCRSFKGIVLKSTLNSRDVFVNPALTEFSKTFNDIVAINGALQYAHADDCYNRAAKAFDEGNIAQSVSLFVEAVNSRNELHQEAVVRLISRKLSIIPQMKTLVAEYKSEVEQMRDKLKRLAKEYVQMGYDCIEDGLEYTPAIANFEKAISLDANCVDAWYGKGIVWLDAGLIDEALECFAHVIELDASHFKAAFQLGHVYRKQGQLHDALNWYFVANDINSQSPELLECIAEIYDEIGDESLADDYRKLASRHRRNKRRKG